MRLWLHRLTQPKKTKENINKPNETEPLILCTLQQTGVKGEAPTYERKLRGGEWLV